MKICKRCSNRFKPDKWYKDQKVCNNCRREISRFAVRQKIKELKNGKD
jgi:PHP family Zn ribbon phosphoesterase